MFTLPRIAIPRRILLLIYMPGISYTLRLLCPSFLWLHLAYYATASPSIPERCYHTFINVLNSILLYITRFINVFNSILLYYEILLFQISCVELFS